MDNTKYMKKKDVTVIFVNLLVLSIVVYIYYIVVNLKTILSNENLCALKTFSKINSDDYDINNSKMAHQYYNIRHTRSTNSVKFQKSCLFSLAQPNIVFEQDGILGPWILSNKSSSVDTYLPIKLTSRRTLFEIIDEGIYLIYIQVYYLSSSKRNSFALTKITNDVNETLSVCSAVGVYGTEISCYTSIVENFKTGESILIRLREMSSTMSLSRKASHTYLGFNKLM